MIDDTLRARIHLVLGGTVTVGDRLPSPDGAQRYSARRGRDAALVTVFPRAPAGPTPEALRSMVDRFRAAQHAALALPRDTVEVDGRACLVTEQPDAPTVLDRLARGTPLPAAEAIAIFRDVARALAALHRRGLTHGNLGLATVHLAESGAVVSGIGVESGGSVAADLEALGRIGYALLAGTAAGTPAEPLSRHRRALPAGLHRLIDSLLDEDRSRRPSRAESVLEALDAVRLRRPLPVPSFLDGASHGARIPRSTPIRVAIALAGILLAAALIIGNR